MATIGNSAPSQNTINYDALLSTTLDAYRPVLIDNIFRDSAFLSLLKMSDGYTSQSGGERIRVPLLYGKNSTIKTQGGYELLDTTPQEGITTAFYEWAEVGGTISISRKEERQNSGEAAILNLLQSKIMQAEMTLKEKMNEDLLRGIVSSATFIEDTSLGGTKGVHPMGYFLRKDNTTDPTSGDVGNIAGDTYDWWRHRTADLSTGSLGNNDFVINVSSYKGIEVAMRRMYNFCSRGSGGSPNMMVGDQVSWETYVNALDTKTRFTNTKMADLGFDTIKVRGSTFIWDEVVPDIESGTTAITKGTVFFINTKFYKVYYDSETDFITTPFIEPENQTAKTAKVLWMGNAGISNMRKNGVVFGIAQDIVS